MAALPIMPVRTDALLSDTGHLSAEEFGSYCRILFTMWRHGGRLPDSEVELARIAGVSERRWAAISERVMRPMTNAGGMVSQKRLSDTWLKVQALRKKRAQAADVRWGNKRTANALHPETGSNATKTKTRIESPSFGASREEFGDGFNLTEEPPEPAEPSQEAADKEEKEPIIISPALEKWARRQAR